MKALIIMVADLTRAAGLLSTQVGPRLNDLSQGKADIEDVVNDAIYAVQASAELKTLVTAYLSYMIGTWEFSKHGGSFDQCMTRARADVVDLLNSKAKMLVFMGLVKYYKAELLEAWKAKESRIMDYRSGDAQFVAMSDFLFEASEILLHADDLRPAA